MRDPWEKIPGLDLQTWLPKGCLCQPWEPGEDSPTLPRHLRAKSWVTSWPLFLMGQVLTCRVTLSPREMSAGVRVLCSKALRAQVLRGLLQRSRYRGQGPGTPCCHSQARPPACWPPSPGAEFSELSFQPCLSVFKDPDSSLQGRHLGNAPPLLGRELFSFLSQTPMTAGQAQEGPAPGHRKQWRVPEDCGTGTWMAHRRPRDHRSEFRPSLRRPWPPLSTTLQRLLGKPAAPFSLSSSRSKDHHGPATFSEFLSKS